MRRKHKTVREREKVEMMKRKVIDKRIPITIYHSPAGASANST